MPQMSPMNWLMLLIFFMLSFYALMSKLHFLLKASNLTKSSLAGASRQTLLLTI